MRLHVALAVAVAALAAPRAASAAPAVVKAFEAPARSAPDRAAPVVHTYVEGAQVSVSEDATGGFRRVRLPDGGVGWIEESAIAIGPAAAPAAPVAAPPPAAPAADLRPHVYVKDLGHLAELVKEDPEVAPKAERLRARRNTALAIGGVGVAASAGLTIAGMSKFGMEGPNGGDKLVLAGLATGLVTTVLVVAVGPRRGDLLDVLNSWNVRHPDRQFQIQEGHLGHDRNR